MTGAAALVTTGPTNVGEAPILHVSSLSLIFSYYSPLAHRRTPCCPGALSSFPRPSSSFPSAASCLSALSALWVPFTDALLLPSLHSSVTSPAIRCRIKLACCRQRSFALRCSLLCLVRVQGLCEIESCLRQPPSGHFASAQHGAEAVPPTSPWLPSSGCRVRDDGSLSSARLWPSALFDPPRLLSFLVFNSSLLPR